MATAQEIAANMAKYLYKQDQARRKIVTFQTDIAGLIPQFLDKILISHSALQWGQSGEIYNRDGDELTLSDPLTDLGSGQTIVFRNIDGSVSTFYDLVIIDSTHITVVGMPSWVTNNTIYTIQNKDSQREFLVISVKPQGESVEITCVNYAPEIYQ
jgi:hypothetical protein